MKKKILIGSLLVLTLLLLMPSIPAIQIQTIKEKAYNDLVALESKYSGKLNQQDREELYGLLDIISSYNGKPIKPPGLDFLIFLLELLSFILTIFTEGQILLAVMLFTVIFIIPIVLFIAIAPLILIRNIIWDIIGYIRDLLQEEHMVVRTYPKE